MATNENLGKAINCECGARFDLQNAPSCKKDGYISIRHKQIQNITARNICVEPQLQQLTGEILQSSTLTGTEICLDICARGFWQRDQMAIFNVRVFNPNTKRYVN